jgi:hypothetical protein
MWTMWTMWTVHIVVSLALASGVRELMPYVLVRGMLGQSYKPKKVLHARMWTVDRPHLVRSPPYPHPTTKRGKR